MKLPEGFNGNAIAKVLEVYSYYDFDEISCQFNEAERIKIHVHVSNNINIGGWKYIYMSNDDITTQTVYNDDTNLYESMDTNSKNDYIYMIKILKIIK